MESITDQGDQLYITLLTIHLESCDTILNIVANVTSVASSWLKLFIRITEG